MRPRIEVVLLLLWTIILMALFCVPWAIRSALWTDEIYSLMTASKRFPEMFASLWSYERDVGVHPPLYFIFLRCALVFGDSPLILRIPSLLFVGGVAVFCVREFRRQGGEVLPAFALGALLILHPEIRSQSVNVRMYPLVILIASLVPILAERLARAATNAERREGGIALAVLLAALFYTNYFGVLFGAGLGLYSLVAVAMPRLVGATDRRNGIALLVACLAGLALFLPWLPPVLRMLHAERGVEFVLWNGTPPTRPEQVLHALIELSGGRAGLVFLAVGWTALAVLSRRGERGRWLLFGLCLALIPFALLSLSVPKGRILNPRYLDFTLPVLFMGAARGVMLLTSARPSRAGAWVAAALFLVPIPFFLMRGREGMFQPMPDWWGAAQIIESNAAPGDSILAGGTLTPEELDYHMSDSRRYNLLRGVMGIDDFYVACRDPRVLWYVNAAPVPDGFMNILRRYFPYRVEFAGNRQQMNGPIRVYAKRPFKLPWGGDAPYAEPVPLDYEEAAKRKAEAAQAKGTPPPEPR